MKIRALGSCLTFPRVCGSSVFSDSIRGIVLRAMNDNQDIEFAETEFRPDSVQPAYPGMLGKVTDAGLSGKRTRLVKSSILAGEGAGGQTRRLGRPGAISNDKDPLVKTHSGVSAKMKTVQETDESTDLGLQTSERERNVREFV